MVATNTPSPQLPRLVVPWSQPEDLTNFIAHQDGGMTINSKPPALEINQDPGGANLVGEVMLFEYGTRGFFTNAQLSEATSSPAPSSILGFTYRLRVHFSRNDVVDGPNSTQWLGISHGSYGTGQPFAATTANTLAQLRVKLGTGSPFQCELAYGPGGGAAVTTKLLSETCGGVADEGSGYLELVIDYPNRRLEGWINGVKGGVMPMAGWNGSRTPSANGLGKIPWFSIFSASGNDAAAQNWYSAWVGAEMEIVLPKVGKL